MFIRRQIYQSFRDIVEGRVSIKHKAWDEVDQMMDGKLRPYIEKVKNGELSHKDLANALKTAINSVYGLTPQVLIIHSGIIEMSII